MLNLTSEMDPGSFSNEYRKAREGFLASVESLDSALLRRRQCHAHPLAGPRQEELACDVVHLGQQEAPRQLLVLISATHGVEGFAGSAIQRDCLALLAPVLRQQGSLGVVMIHAINPWGFAWLRRYDHEGIDLNRNFIDFGAALPENPQYDALHQRIMAMDVSDAALLPSLWQDMTPAAFAEVVTRGQYTHADGLFYGGRAPSWSRGVLEQITRAPHFATAERMAVIDLHTGLGAYGYGEVINDHPPGSKGFALAQQWYGDNAQSTVLGQSVSSLKQGLLDYHWHEVMGARGCFVTLEFGTYPMDRLLLSLVSEQQYHSRLTQSGGSRDVHQETVRSLQHFFYPAEKSWQQQVLFRGRQVVDMALEGLFA